jgi:GTP diphosphokinase / guanosine-3',5'-bis(diphosphate) 3'-diphosphatase
MNNRIVTFNELDDEIRKYITDAKELDTIEAAYQYAYEHHLNKVRKTGEAYINHPLNVAMILTTLNVDYITISAALLHETINHGGATKKDITDHFGPEIANIVDCISKINKLTLSDDKKISAINLRKVLVGLSEDVRVLFIKLADRLHNMRTIYAIEPDAQKEKINETLNVLIPIAQRLGINSISSELEDLCLRYSKPDIYFEIVERLNKTSAELNQELEAMKASISDILTAHGIKFTIKGRVKSVHSIYEKMVNGHKWSEIYDILALRIIVSRESDCYLAIGLIHAKYRPIPNRFKDYIAMPKPNMYQSLHTSILGVDGYVFEVQIRTYEMDEIAEKGFASHWSYKEHSSGQIQNVMDQKLELFRNLIEQNSENKSDTEFEKSINSEVLSKMIYCFTPKGDVVELPVDATPIDFAYRIHSHVGDTTVGALVNGKIVTLNSSLKDGDIITIKTLNTATPSKEWLDFVKTSQARNKIKSYFSKQDRENYIDKGKDILEKEIRKRKLAFNDVLNDNNIKKICNDLKLNDLDDIYLSIGSLRYTANYIINLINDDKKNVADILLEKVNTKETIVEDHKSDIIVAGTDNIKVSLAKCCKPVKGEPIIGYITKGQGITVHKADCPNIKNERDRLIEVCWNINNDNDYLVDLNIEVILGKNYLLDIIAHATSKNITVETVSNHEEETGIIYTITVKVKDTQMLENFIDSLKNLKFIKRVERVTL